jgi:hypothetical protein
VKREQKRAAERAAAKTERESARVANRPKGTKAKGDDGGILEAEDETARRIYRTGGKATPRGRPARLPPEKPKKWREGRL